MVDPNLRTPYVFQYNTTLQQQLPSNMLLELGYVGYSAHKMTRFDGCESVCDRRRRAYSEHSCSECRSHVLPFANLYEFQNISRANYNSFQANLTRRASSSRLGSAFFTIGYTLGHEIDNVSGFRQRNLVPAYDHEAFRASGDTDVRHTFTLSGGWDLPLSNSGTAAPSFSRPAGACIRS